MAKPEQPVVTEQTDRKWKKMQLMGFFACVAAVVMFFAEGDGWKFGGFILLLLGLLVFCLGRIFAWWYHG